MLGATVLEPVGAPVKSVWAPAVPVLFSVSAGLRARGKSEHRRKKRNDCQTGEMSWRREYAHELPLCAQIPTRQHCTIRLSFIRSLSWQQTGPDGVSGLRSRQIRRRVMPRLK